MIVNMVAPWGTKYHYMSGIHTNVTTVQLPSGQAWYSYLWDKPQNGGNDPVNCVSVPSAVTVSGWREGGIGSMHYEKAPPLSDGGSCDGRSNCNGESGAKEPQKNIGKPDERMAF